MLPHQQAAWKEDQQEAVWKEDPREKLDFVGDLRALAPLTIKGRIHLTI